MDLCPLGFYSRICYILSMYESLEGSFSYLIGYEFTYAIPPRMLNLDIQFAFHIHFILYWISSWIHTIQYNIFIVHCSVWKGAQIFWYAIAYENEPSRLSYVCYGWHTLYQRNYCNDALRTLLDTGSQLARDRFVTGSLTGRRFST